MTKTINHINKLIILTSALVLFTIRANAQGVKVVDNKGTITTVNKVTTSNSAPTTPIEGDIWYNNTTASNVITSVFDGTIWKEITTNFQRVYVGSFIISNNAANKIIINGLPFKPSQITFNAHANIEAFGLDSDNGVGNNNSGLNNAFGTMNGFARNDGAITQGVIYSGGSGNSINDISRYSSDKRCIGIRYSNQNGDKIGLITASLASFNTAGFTLDVTYAAGAPTTENILVFYTAYK